MFDRKILTLFSAPNYCGEFDNAGAMMIVDEDLKCSFKVLRPAVHKSKYPEEYPDYVKGEKTSGLLDEAPDREKMYDFLHTSVDTLAGGEDGNQAKDTEVEEVNDTNNFDAEHIREAT